MASSQKKKQKSGDFLIQGAILASAGMITRIIGIADRVPLTYIVGDEGMGFYGYAFEVYSIALLLSSYSLPLAVSKLVSARMAKGEKRNAIRVFLCALVFACAVGLLISLIIGFGAGGISTYLMSAPFSRYALRVLAPGLFIVAIMGVIRGYFQGMGTMLPTAVSQIIEQIVNAIVSLMAASYLLKVGTAIAKARKNDLYGPAYAAAGGTLGTVVGAFGGLIFLVFVLACYRKTMKRQLRPDPIHEDESYETIVKIMLFTIAPVILSTAIYNISQVLDQLLFSHIMAAQGYAESKYVALLGIFTGKYNTLINVPLAMANALGASVIPSLTAAVSVGDREQIHKKIQLTIRFAMLVAIPSFMGYVVIASPIMQLLYGDARKTPAYMLTIGAITVVFYCLSTVSNAILQGLNRMTTPVKNAAMSLGIHIVALLIMMIFLKWNIYAIVVANIIFSLSMCILNARAIYQACGYRQEYEQTFIRPFLASAIMGIVTLLVHKLFDLIIGGRIATILAILIAIAVYAVSVLKLKVLTEAEIRSMPKGTTILNLCKKAHLL